MENSLQQQGIEITCSFYKITTAGTMKLLVMYFMQMYCMYSIVLVLSIVQDMYSYARLELHGAVQGGGIHGGALRAEHGTISG